LRLQPLLVSHESSPTICVPGGAGAAQARARAAVLRDWAELRGVASGGHAFVRDLPGAGYFVHLPTCVPVAAPADSGIAADVLRGGISLAIARVPFEAWSGVAAMLRQKAQGTWAVGTAAEFHPDDEAFEFGTVTLAIRPCCGDPAPARPRPLERARGVRRAASGGGARRLTMDVR
jgi:hypothetical protein